MLPSPATTAFSTMPPTVLLLLLLSFTLLSTSWLCQAQEPYLIVEVEPSPAVEDQDTKLSCILLHVQENVTFNWIVPGDVDKSSFVFSSNNQSLTIPSVARAYDGAYTCQAQLSSGKRLEKEKQLDVNYGPESLKLFVRHKLVRNTDLEAMPLAVRNGESVNMFCDGSSKPEMKVSWTKNSVKLDADHKNLILSNIQLEHTGVYTCEGYNKVTGDKINASISIFLQEPVSKPWVDMDKTKILERSGSVKMKCNHKAIKECWYVWLWKGWPIPADSDRRYILSDLGKAMELESVWMGDAGQFQCMVQNNVSMEASEPVHLKVITEDLETTNQVKVVVVGLGSLVSLFGVGLLVCFLKNKV